MDYQQHIVWNFVVETLRMIVERDYSRRWKYGESCANPRSGTEKDLYKLGQMDKKI